MSTGTGGIRQDFTSEEGFTPYERRPLRWAGEDENGDALTDFTDWAVSLYIGEAAAIRDAQGTTALAAAALLELSTGGAEVDVGTPPNIDATIEVADWDDLGATIRSLGYELWRTDGTNDRRLAYGVIELVP